MKITQSISAVAGGLGLPNTIITRNLLVAGLYLIAGYLTLLLVPAPSYAVSIWPPAGIAFVAVLCFGYRMLPGVFVGAMPLTLQALGRGFEVVSPATALSLAAVEGAAITAQTAVAVWLVRRCVGYPFKLDRPRAMCAFFVLAGPVACLLSATVSTLVLYQGGGVSGLEPWNIHWLSWWVGDTLGTWLFGVVGLCFFARPARIWRPRRGMVALPLLAACVPMVVAQVAASHNLAQQHRMAFSQTAERVAYRVEARLNRKLGSLMAISSAHLGSDELTTAEFNRVSRPLDGGEASLMRLMLPEDRYSRVSLLPSPLGPISLDDSHHHEFEQSISRAIPRLTVAATQTGSAFLLALPITYMHALSGVSVSKSSDLILAMTDTRELVTAAMREDMPRGLDIRLRNAGAPAREIVLASGGQGSPQQLPYYWRDEISVGGGTWFMEVQGLPDGYRRDWLHHTAISVGAGLVYCALLVAFLLLQSGRFVHHQLLVSRVLR